jgi:hypothetical protein
MARVPHPAFPQMHQVQPYRQGVLDITQGTARLLSLALFLAVGISNYLVFGADLNVGSQRGHRGAAGN